MNGAVSKTVVGLSVHRGFESLPLRYISQIFLTCWEFGLDWLLATGGSGVNERQRTSLLAEVHSPAIPPGSAPRSTARMSWSATGGGEHALVGDWRCRAPAPDRTRRTTIFSRAPRSNSPVCRGLHCSRRRFSFPGFLGLCVRFPRVSADAAAHRPFPPRPSRDSRARFCRGTRRRCRPSFPG